MYTSSLGNKTNFIFSLNTFSYFIININKIIILLFLIFYSDNEQITNATKPRLCTPAEIDEKRKRAILLLKYKLSNKTNA